MRTKIFRILALPLLAFLTLGANCPLIPSIEERLVELATMGSAEVEFTSQGDLNVIDETRTIDLVNDFDLAQVLEDADIDVADVKNIKVAGASYVTTQPELGTPRVIEHGTITIQRAGGPVVTLVSDFTESVNDVLSYKAAPLNAAGVAVVNDLLADVLADLQGQPAGNTTVTYHLTGTSFPPEETTDFKWKLKIDISVVGTIEVDVLN